MSGSLTPNEIADALEVLLNDPEVGENALQDFLETHTEAVLTPHLLNHRLHFGSLISKFRIGGLSTDFAYLTKSSDIWRLVLVELEAPQKQIFKKSGKHEATTSEFNDAIAQVHAWRDLASADMAGIQKRIAPLQAHMAKNALEIWYVLVIGRDKELKNQDRRQRRLAGYLQSEKMQVLTWDSLLRELRERSVDRKCVLSETSRGFRIKHMDRIPPLIFGWVGPGHLEVAEPELTALKAAGYHMDEWREGELLTFNEKMPSRLGRDAFRAALVSARAKAK